MKGNKKSTVVLFAILVFGLILVFVGFGISGFSFASISGKGNVINIDKTYEISDNYSILMEDTTTNIIIRKSFDDNVHLSYQEVENDYKYEVYLEGNELTIKRVDFRNRYFDFIRLSNIIDRYLYIDLPEKDINSITIKCSTGDIYVRDIYKTNKMECAITTGDIEISNCKVNILDLASKTGEIDVYNTEAKLINASTTTGSHEFGNVNSEEVNVTASTGDVEFDNINSLIINIKTTTGDVEGSLFDDVINYNVKVKTSTGRKNIRQYDAGDKMLNITTTTGDIDVSFNDKD